MDPLFYKVLHIAGILGLFTAMGSLLAADRKKPVMLTKFVIMHGVSLLVIFVSGFGMQAKMQLGWPGYLITKMVIWFLFGAMIAVLKRGLLSPTKSWIIMIGLGTFAGYLAIYKPF